MNGVVQVSDTRVLNLPFSCFILSDLHLEHLTKPVQKYFKRLPPPQKAEVLVLAGDIGNPGKPHYVAFLAHCAAAYPHIIVIAGNHEYWHQQDDGASVCRQVCARWPNVHFLERETWTYKGVTFVGCTLWSEAKQLDGTPTTREGIAQLNDFRCIPSWSAAQHVARHKLSVRFITQCLQTFPRCVTVTHHAPHFEGIAPKFRGDVVNGLYASDLSKLLQNPNLVAWIFGHTHRVTRWEIVETGSLLLTNAGRETDYTLYTTWDMDSGVLSPPPPPVPVVEGEGEADGPGGKADGPGGKAGGPGGKAGGPGGKAGGPGRTEAPVGEDDVVEASIKLEGKGRDGVGLHAFALTMETLGVLMGTLSYPDILKLWTSIDEEMPAISYTLEKLWTQHVVPEIPNLPNSGAGASAHDHKETFLGGFLTYVYAKVKMGFWTDHAVHPETKEGRAYAEMMRKMAEQNARTTWRILSTTFRFSDVGGVGEAEAQRRLKVDRAFYALADRAISIVAHVFHKLATGETL